MAATMAVEIIGLMRGPVISRWQLTCRVRFPRLLLMRSNPLVEPEPVLIRLSVSAMR